MSATFPAVRFDAADGILQKGKIGNAYVYLWEHTGGADITIHQPEYVEAHFVPTDARPEGSFVSVKFREGKDEVKGYITTEQAVALRDALNNVIAQAERHG